MKATSFFNLDSLIDEYVEHERVRLRYGIRSALGRYHSKRLRAFKKAFGLDFGEAQTRIDSQRVFDVESPEVHYEINFRSTNALLSRCILLLATDKSPFGYGEMFEGMPPKKNRQLENYYGAALEENIVLLDAVYYRIARDILIFLFPQIESARVDEVTLRNLGLPTVIPDLSDDF